jgi:hypothetical protein
MRLLSLGLGAVLSVGLLSVPALAQDNGGNGDDDAPQPVLDKVRGGALRERAPGQTIQDALARHRDLQNDRLNGGVTPDPDDGDAGLGGGNGDGGLGDLLDSFGLGGLSGTLDSLGGLLGTAGGSTGTTAGGSTGTTAGGSLQTLLDLRDSLSRRPINAGGGDNDAASGATVNPLTAQTNNGGTGELPFRTRLVNSWLGAFFTALTFGFSSADFVDLIAVNLQPLFTPLDPGNGDNGGTDGGNGEGIEDTDPGTDNSDGGDSLVRAGPGRAIALLHC